MIADKTKKKFSVNPLYQRYPRSINPYIELKTFLSDELRFIFLLEAVPREKSPEYVMASESRWRWRPWCEAG